MVSIPQAVSAVATNVDSKAKNAFERVSIPQAVSAVATNKFASDRYDSGKFQYRKR